MRFNGSNCSSDVRTRVSLNKRLNRKFDSQHVPFNIYTQDLTAR
jgi:hypothetical protein